MLHVNFELDVAPNVAVAVIALTIVTALVIASRMLS
jgi:hypothetical protein